MPTIQPKTPDVWVVGARLRQEVAMLLLMGAGLAWLGWLALELLQNTPRPWVWWPVGLLVTGFGAEWAFFEDRWVIDRRSRTAFLCRPFRRTLPLAFDRVEKIEVTRLPGGAWDVHFLMPYDTRQWVARGRAEEFERSVPQLAEFMEVPWETASKESNE